MPEQHPIEIKQELLYKLKQRYRDVMGEDLPVGADFTDAEIAYTLLLWLIDEVI